MISRARILPDIFAQIVLSIGAHCKKRRQLFFHYVGHMIAHDVRIHISVFHDRVDGHCVLHPQQAIQRMKHVKFRARI